MEPESHYRNIEAVANGRIISSLQEFQELLKHPAGEMLSGAWVPNPFLGAVIEP